MIWKEYPFPIYIASMGRCASSRIAHQIHKAMGTPDIKYVWDFKNSCLASDPPYVYKTHSPMNYTGPSNYRAVYVWGNKLSIIASLYVMDDLEWLIRHFHNLHVESYDQETFRRLFSQDRELAWAYILTNDRVRLSHNYKSWRNQLSQTDNILFVNYEALIANVEAGFQRISEFLGLQVESFVVEERTSSIVNLPERIYQLVRN